MFLDALTNLPVRMTQNDSDSELLSQGSQCPSGKKQCCLTQTSSQSVTITKPDRVDTVQWIESFRKIIVRC